MTSLDINPSDWTMVRNTAAAILFLQAGMYSLDAYSSVNSSPWTAETVGGDEDKAKSMKGYCIHATAIASIASVSAAMISESWWPIIGGAFTLIYLGWLYSRALKRGFDEGSQWQSARSNL